MGCCTSNIKGANTSLDAYYSDGQQTPKRSASKRSYMSRISSGSSSGVSSRCTTPSRRSILSRCSGSKKFSPTKGVEQLSICDDFCDGVKLQQLQQQDMDKSFGYFTDSSPSTPSRTSLRRTQDMSGLERQLNVVCLGEDDSVYKTLTSDLDMEMYMMTHADGLMQKTSSPLMLRKDLTYDMPAVSSSPQPPSNSYNKWSQYLQSTPTYMLHNVTNIPEAIAGHFSPPDFPAYSDLDDMESVAKRYKVDVHPQPMIGLTQTITTDL